METGGKHPDLRDTSNFTQLFADRHLVINLRYDGLTILVADPESKKVLEILETSWLAAKDAGYLIDEIEKYFSENGISLSRAAHVHWVLSFSKFTLIPDIFFDQGNGTQLLEHTTRLEEDDLVHSDFWPQYDVVCLYAVPQKLKAYIERLYERSTIAHFGHSLNSLHQLQSHKSNFCFLQVSAAFAEIFIVQNDQLILSNQFAYDVNEDLLYYILFALEQNRILTPEVELRYAGKIQKGDNMYKLLTTYIGNVEEIGIPAGVSSERHLSPNQLKRSAHLIASL